MDFSDIQKQKKITCQQLCVCVHVLEPRQSETIADIKQGALKDFLF